MRIRFFNILFIFVLLLTPLSIYLSITPRVILTNTEKLKKPRVKRLDDFTLGTYQRVADVWAFQQSRLWSLFVKAENTLNYHLFGLASEKYTNDTFMGKSGVLFDRIYMNDFNGTYASETPDPKEYAKQVKDFQDLLESHGKKFVIILHPSKTVMNPDWVPESFKVGQPNPRMVDILEPELRKSGVHIIKVSEVLTDKSLRYWPKSGAHLNSLGKCLSAKSLLAFFKSSKNIHLPQIECEYNPALLTPASGEDLDLVKLINAWKVSGSIEDVPVVKMITASIAPGHSKPSALFVGTSYTFGLLRMLRLAKAFSDTDFIFYDKTLYSVRNIAQPNQQTAKERFRKNLHSLDFILKHDIVVIESTEARLHQLGFGIIKNVLEAQNQ